MERKRHLVIAVIFYILGLLAAIYVGVFIMLAKPLYYLFTGYMNGTLTIAFVIRMAIRIICSGTLGGFIWCVGYAMFNHFMGTEDPDWNALNPKPEYDELEDMESSKL